MVLTYRYKTIKNRPISEETKTPLIPITIMSKITIDTTAIPDSGADISAIPHALAEGIGLNMDGEKDKCVGIGGSVDSIESKMKIRIGNSREHYSFTIPVKIILDNYQFPILLGRKGFFDKFSITFDENGQKVRLKRYNKQFRFKR